MYFILLINTCCLIMFIMTSRDFNWTAFSSFSFPDSAKILIIATAFSLIPSQHIINKISTCFCFLFVAFIFYFFIFLVNPIKANFLNVVFCFLKHTRIAPGNPALIRSVPYTGSSLMIWPDWGLFAQRNVSLGRSFLTRPTARVK